MPFDPFERRTAYIAALPGTNIDTDVIMPKTFLKGIDRSGLDRGLFHDLRFDESENPRPDFVLNRSPWNEASFLVTGANFGCGSSREHAVWGLRQFGISAIVAPSFAGIFFDNCARNGLLAVEASDRQVEMLIEHAQTGAGEVTVDLETQTIATPERSFHFDIDGRRKTMLLNGLDAVGMTLQWREEIEAFQSGYLTERGWLA